MSSKSLILCVFLNNSYFLFILFFHENLSRGTSLLGHNKKTIYTRKFVFFRQNFLLRVLTTHFKQFHTYRFIDWIVSLDSSALQKDQQDMASREVKMQEQITSQQRELEKTKLKMAAMATAVEEQAEMMRIMVASIDRIPSEEFKKYAVGYKKVV